LLIAVNETMYFKKPVFVKVILSFTTGLAGSMVELIAMSLAKPTDEIIKRNTRTKKPLVSLFSKRGTIFSIFNNLKFNFI